MTEDQPYYDLTTYQLLVGVHRLQKPAYVHEDVVDAILDGVLARPWKFQENDRVIIDGHGDHWVPTPFVRRFIDDFYHPTAVVSIYDLFQRLAHSDE